MSEVPMSVVNWLAGGERGISSETIVSHIWALPKSRRHGYDHPYDPDDLKRCLKLLAASPETKARFSEMRAVSREWANLVDNWETLERLFLREVGDIKWSNRKHAPITYGAMKRCYEANREGQPK